MKPGNRYFVIFSAILLLICVFAGCGQNPSKAENAIYEYEEDYLPKEADLCIFYACAADDGELIVSGANSTVKLGEAKVQEGSASARDAWKKEKAYEILVEAAKHPILTDRVRSISSYDAE